MLTCKGFLHVFKYIGTCLHFNWLVPCRAWCMLQQFVCVHLGNGFLL